MQICIIFENSVKSGTASFKAYYLDLLAYRAISDEVATIYQITHQSPQIIFIKSGLVLRHASHYEITQLNIQELLENQPKLPF